MAPNRLVHVYGSHITAWRVATVTFNAGDDIWDPTKRVPQAVLFPPRTV